MGRVAGEAGAGVHAADGTAAADAGCFVVVGVGWADAVLGVWGVLAAELVCEVPAVVAAVVVVGVVELGCTFVDIVEAVVLHCSAADSVAVVGCTVVADDAVVGCGAVGCTVVVVDAAAVGCTVAVDAVVAAAVVGCTAVVVGCTVADTAFAVAGVVHTVAVCSADTVAQCCPLGAAQGTWRSKVEAWR